MQAATFNLLRSQPCRFPANRRNPRGSVVLHQEIHRRGSFQEVSLAREEKIVYARRNTSNERSIMLDQLFDVCTDCSSVCMGSGCSVLSLLVGASTMLRSPRRSFSCLSTYRERASDEELIAAESLALLLTDATWGDPLCSPGRGFPYQHACCVQVWVHRVQECTQRCAASACGDRTISQNTVCGISMGHSEVRCRPAISNLFQSRGTRTTLPANKYYHLFLILISLCLVFYMFQGDTN